MSELTALRLPSSLFKDQPIKGVLSDLDGTLVDSAALMYQTVRLILRRFKIELSLKEFTHYLGLGPYTSSHKMVADFTLPCSPNSLAQERIDLMMQLASHAVIPVMPGARELLHYLHIKKVPIAVASASPREHIASLLKSAKLDSFVETFLSGCEDVPCNKPAPDIYIAAAKALGVPIRECLILEDSPTGIEAACHSGGIVVAISPASHQIHHPVHLRLDSLHALGSIVRAEVGVGVTLGTPDLLHSTLLNGSAIFQGG